MKQEAAQSKQDNELKTIADVEGESDIVETLTEKMPEPSEHAIQSEKEKVEKEKLIDSAGTKFDPSYHRVDENGDPVRTPTGKFRKQTKKKTTDSVIGKLPGQSTGSIVDAAQAAVNGKAAAALLLTSCIVLGGQDFQPRVGKVGDIEIDEQKMLENAFADYLIATGKADLSPGFALAVAISGYVLPRFMMENTKTRTKKLGARVYLWWQNRKGKKVKAKKEEKKEEK